MLHWCKWHTAYFSQALSPISLYFENHIFDPQVPLST